MSSLQSKPQKRRKPRRVSRVDSEQLDCLDSLPWHSSLPEFTSTDDTFSIVAGFLSLEEIDESAYGLEIPKFEEEVKSKKRKASESGNVGGDDEKGVGNVEDEGECGGEEDKEVKSTNKKMMKRSRKKKKVREKWEVAKVVTFPDVPEEDAFEDGEFYAWNELRLHPLIMKSIYRLKFKEPTPIQKACILAATHQGKDVIGAAKI
ncbi:DEAD-box ATP-dependent RNA helicase 13-like [Apium graveolens]|uniref:DEAD-box ATP-dependent RNA helicase 13-like n=1 Tax=Apium graveolens TaxID=4045 RepID=UPI003D79F44E